MKILSMPERLSKEDHHFASTIKYTGWQQQQLGLCRGP